MTIELIDLKNKRSSKKKVYDLYNQIDYTIDMILFFTYLFISIFYIRDTIKNSVYNLIYYYDKLKNSGVTFQCNIGGSSIQNAECQIIQGINISLVYCVSSIMEYTSGLFQTKNVTEIISKLFTLLCFFRVVVLNLIYLLILLSYKLHNFIHNILYKGIDFLINFYYLTSNYGKENGYSRS